MPQQTKTVVVDGQAKTIPVPFPSPVDWRDCWIYFLLLDRFNNADRPPASPAWNQRFDFRHGGTFATPEASTVAPYRPELLRVTVADQARGFTVYAFSPLFLDGGFAGPDVLGFLEATGVEYVVALGRNRRVDQRAQRLLGKARMRARASDATEHVYGETRYAAATWTRKQRVIIKAEVVCHPGRTPKNNPRFVVTNLPHTPQHVYEIYRARGDVENRIKELKAGLALDRLSCSRFLGNQFRLLLTLAAYILVQALRHHAAGTACATAQVTTLRERLLKVAVWIERSVRRIVLHFPTSFVVPVAADLAGTGRCPRRHVLTRRHLSRPPHRGRRVDLEPRSAVPSERASPSAHGQHADRIKAVQPCPDATQCHYRRRWRASASFMCLHA
jgi:DDE family transposase